MDVVGHLQGSLVKPKQVNQSLVVLAKDMLAAFENLH